METLESKGIITNRNSLNGSAVDLKSQEKKSELEEKLREFIQVEEQRKKDKEKWREPQRNVGNY